MSSQPTRWVCSVCGYVHDGPQPPEFCPVCGATADLFEPQAAAPAASGRAARVSRWRCLNCDYLHEGDAPPEFCPVCGVGSDQFEACPDQPAIPLAAGESGHVVIAGAGIAGVCAAEAARQASPEARITLLGKEEELPYYRLNLTRYLAGEIGADQLPMHDREWYAKRNIELRLGCELRRIDPQQRQLTLADGELLAYDRLVLAIGSHPFVPPMAGGARENVTVLRTRQDAERVLGWLHPEVACVVIGGGLLGLETAGALVRRGAQVTLLESFGWLLPQQLNRRAGELLGAYAERFGIEVLSDVRIRQIDGDERARGVALEDGRFVPADVVIITAGVRTNSYLARLAGLEVNQGVLVDDALRSSVPEIYAAGDVAEHRGVTYGTWAPAQFQGTIAGMNAAGGAVEFGGIPRSNLLKVLGYDMLSIGQVHPGDGSYQIFDWGEGEDYCQLVFRDDRLVGAVLLGEMRHSAAVKHLIEGRRNCAELLHANPDPAALEAFLESVPR